MTNDRLSAIVASFRNKRVAVVGDLMLDVYVWGKASRISPEAPVPVVQVKNRTHCLGGAGNVMRNLTALGGSSMAFGVIGGDENGETVLRLLDSEGIGRSGLCIEHSRQTTEKQRVIAAGQQLLRIDYENVEPVSEVARRQMTAALLEMISARAVDAVIFEDYAKGMLCCEMVQTVSDAARRAGIIAALDPNPKHQMLVSGLTVMKPNRQEAYAMAGKFQEDSSARPDGDESLREVASILMERWKPDYLLISLAADGMALFARDGEMTLIPTKAREVFDVSGAGDTVIATFTLALAAGADGVEAATIANHAAGVVVGKVGTAPITRDELLESLKNGV